MFEQILKYAAEDALLKKLLDASIDYARVYFFAKMRQKGCDGMGEMATLKDEFKSALDEMIRYCREKGYIDDNILYDADDIADELLKIRND